MATIDRYERVVECCGISRKTERPYVVAKRAIYNTATPSTGLLWIAATGGVTVALCMSTFDPIRRSRFTFHVH
jgi:hypothetical protein